MRPRFASVPPSEELMTQIIQARTDMIINAPFFGNVVMKLEVIVVPDDSKITTAATDGRYLLINGKFFSSIQPKERTYVVGHELGHAILDHAGTDGRRGHRDAYTWNVAADHIVNNMIEQAHIGQRVSSNGFKPFVDPKYAHDYSVEMVYEDLIKNNRGKPLSPGSGGQLVDDHLDTGTIRPVGKDEDGNTIYEIAEASNVPSQETDRVRQEMRAAVISAAMTARSMGGNVPAGVDRMMEEWANPEIDWRELLHASLSAAFTDDYSYSRPSKKSWSTNVILPGMTCGEHVHLCIGFDQSGSIGNEEASHFLAETYAIMQMYSSFTIHVWCYDTDVYGYAKFTEENLDELKDYQVKGGGGTCFDCSYEYMKENEIVPTQYINFTDGLPYGSWGDPDYTDTVFILTTRAKPPFGAFAYFDGV